jgi:hypothetical protein
MRIRVRNRLRIIRKHLRIIRNRADNYPQMRIIIRKHQKNPRGFCGLSAPNFTSRTILQLAFVVQPKHMNS